MKQAAIRKAFVDYLRQRALRLTPQRARIFDRAFSTHEHFSAETLFGWLREEQGPRTSRATVYRTLALLVEGHFLDCFDSGKGELLYEHVMGHRHHDHLMCTGCGRIEEFFDDRIERIQEEICARYGFELVDHDHRLRGLCKACARKRPREASDAEQDAGRAEG